MKVESESRHGAEVYHYRFKDTFGWAVFIICEDMGTFSVISDWGNGEYRWNNTGESSLKAFLAHTNSDYVTEKFQYEHRREFEDEVDVEATGKELRRHILELRRGKDIGRDDARECWDDIDTFVGDLEDGSVDVALHNVIYLGDHIDELWEFVCKKRSARYRFFVDELLPFFFAELRKELEHGT